MANHYEILQVSQQATFAELKRAYYRRAKECHPDRFSGDRGKEAEFKLLVQAFDVLSEPGKRREYDISLGLAAAAAANGGQEGGGPVLDTVADDILEELVVGNVLLPPGTTLQTLMLDLERTEVFCLFREGKCCLAAGQVEAAWQIFLRTVSRSPYNILHRYYLAMAAARLRKLKEAEQHLEACLELGAARHPPLRLERIRGDLARVREQRRGRLWRWLYGDTAADRRRLGDASAESMCRELGAAMNRENARQRRKSLPPGRP